MERIEATGPRLDTEERDRLLPAMPPARFPGANFAVEASPITLKY